MIDGNDQHPEVGRPDKMHPQDSGQEMEILYDKKYDCPLCGAALTSKKIRSRFIKPLKMDTDFCQVFSPEQPNPLHYYVIICPGCCYGFYEDSSRIPGNVREELTRQLDSWQLVHTKSYCGERSLYDVIETYRLALTLAETIHEISINQAGLNIRLAWLFRSQQDRVNEMKYLSEALRHYEQSYYNGDFVKTNTTEIQLLYLIGELSRRLKNYAEAIRFFGMVIFHEDKSRNRKIVGLARDQWALAREEHKRENNGYTNLKEMVDE